MHTTHIAEKGLPGGILVITEGVPTPEELNQAVKDFHKYPVLRETAMVILLDPEKLAQKDISVLRQLGVPGYGEEHQEPRYH